jgi:nitroimidazol reductase NimA-like FMN-containing flavoprotein (pyridoxamine 5'-phosphate oxidase superfamily)
VLVLAQEEAQRFNHNYIGTEHLLLGLVREGEGIAAGVLESLGVNLERVRTQIIQVVSQSRVVSQSGSGPQPAPGGGAEPAAPRPGRGMTPEEVAQFLGGAWNAKVGCVTDEGAPYVVPAWYEWDGEAFWLVPRARSAWARYLQTDPRVSLCIDEEAAPHRRVQVLGRAEIVEEPNVGGRWVPIAERMATRYLGPVDGPRYLVPTLDRPRWLVRVHPQKVTTWAGGEWHPRYLP